jgi:hypothetical protein
MPGRRDQSASSLEEAVLLVLGIRDYVEVQPHFVKKEKCRIFTT